MNTSEKDPTLDAIFDRRLNYEQAQVELRDAVEAARAAGQSWELVARELGTTRQAAWERYAGQVCSTSCEADLSLPPEWGDELTLRADPLEDPDAPHPTFVIPAARALELARVLVDGGRFERADGNSVTRRLKLTADYDENPCGPVALASIVVAWSLSGGGYELHGAMDAPAAHALAAELGRRVVANDR